MKKAELTQVQVKTPAGYARMIWKKHEGNEYALLVRAAWDKNYFSHDGGRTWFKSSKEALMAILKEVA